MPRSKSSHKWLKEHFNDPFVKQAQQEGYRSRAVYKLKEIDAREGLIRPGMTVLELGAAPGGWTQYISEKMAQRGTIIAMDCLPMDAFAGVTFIQGDFADAACYQQLQQAIPTSGIDLILSDIAPNMSGNAVVDITRAIALAELVFDFALHYLQPDGALLLKLFHGAGFDALVKQIKQHFNRVVIRKPQASRPRSRETYLVAKGKR